jgi:hypothetical protein
MLPFIFLSKYRRERLAVTRARKRTSRKTDNVILVLMLVKFMANPVCSG